MLFEATTLPNGVQLKNRLVKAAMEENMAAAGQDPSAQLIELYRHWALGGTGLLISGNVMISRKALTGPGGVVLDAKSDLTLFQSWAEAGQQNDTKLILQLNHPGRQMPANLGQQAIAPSAVALDLGQFSKMFASPRAMTLDDIAEFKQQFLVSSQLALQAGFAGVQIHAAHGYLLSQFLSPLVNQRQDQYGGPLENRARLLLELVTLLRYELPANFIISLKLNSADFQRGGFSTEDARQVLLWLNPLALDFVELSGGSYEAPAMQGDSRDGSTLAREAYFLDFAKELQQSAQMPLMVTGGIHRPEVAEQVLASGVAMIGIATALAIEPDLPQHWQQGRDPVPTLRNINWRSKPLAASAHMAAVKYQLGRLSRRRPTAPTVSPVWALLLAQAAAKCRTRRYRRWIGARAIAH